MNLFAQMVEELRASDYPVILYGAGVSSTRTRKYLEDNSISVDGYVVDEEYLPKERLCDGKPVYSLKEYTKKSDCNIIFSAMRIPEGREKWLEESGHVKKLYALDLPGSFLLDNFNVMSNEFYQLHKTTLDKLRNDLCDEESKFQFDEFIHQKRFGNYRKRYSKNTMYFDNDFITFSENEVFVDCGAYDGDTILSFVDNLKFGNMFIYAFESDKVNVEKMRRNLKDLKDIEIIPKGVYDYTGTLFFNNDGTTESHVCDSGEKIEVTTIDDIVKDNNVTFIKMDIEGSELKAIKGAEKTIKRCKPKLAICVYHKVEDLITIPQYIQSLNPDYKLYFRNYADPSMESVIYAL